MVLLALLSVKRHLSLHSEVLLEPTIRKTHLLVIVSVKQTAWPDLPNGQAEPRVDETSASELKRQKAATPE
jgi:hypothetical protein